MREGTPHFFNIKEDREGLRHRGAKKTISLAHQRDRTRTVLFCSRLYNRVLRPGLAELLSNPAGEDSALRRDFDRLDKTIDAVVEGKGLSA